MASVTQTYYRCSDVKAREDTKVNRSLLGGQVL